MRRPRFIAEQARDARGILGRALAAIMARETWRENLRTMDALGIGASDRVLDLGCGHGRSLGELAARASRGHVVGVDSSALMCEIAERRSGALVRSGHVEVVHAGAECLPFANAAFDRALCVHVAYFWPDLGAALREIGRVVAPGGRLALVARTSANAGAVRAFPSDVYRFRALAELLGALRAAGFEPASGDDRDETREAVCVLATRTARAPA